MNNDNIILQLLIEFASKSSGGVIIFDNSKNQVAHINHSAEQITGLHGGSSLADVHLLISLLPEEDRCYLAMRAEQMKSESSGGQIEFSLPRTDSDPIDICASGFSIAQDTFTIVFVEDITEKKAHEDYLVEFTTKKNTTLDGIFHFMSGAITLMRNLSVEAARSMKSDNISSMNMYLDLIDQNSTHCLAVVKRLLQEEHSKSPSITIKTSRIDIVQKIGYIIDHLRSSYPARIFDFRNSSRKILVDVDEIKLLQIINNLAFNAIKFSSPEMPVTIGVTESDERVVIHVSDAGIGIPPEMQPYIFDRNTTAGRPGLKGEQSFGVGLSICKALAKLMHGELWFESAAGKGSTFFFSIPRASIPRVSSTKGTSNDNSWKKASDLQ